MESNGTSGHGSSWTVAPAEDHDAQPPQLCMIQVCAHYCVQMHTNASSY